MKVTRPLSGRGKKIVYWCDADTITVEWGETRFSLSRTHISTILNGFFRDSAVWYQLGASMTDPPTEGLGYFVYTRFPSLSPRHASAIAAVLVNEGVIQHRGSRPIELKKL